MDSSQPSPRQQIIVWWVLWAAFLQGIFMIYFFLGKHGADRVEPATPDSPLWLVAVTPVAVSAIIRWVVLPKLTHPQTGLVALIVGIALAEASCFLGLFVFSRHQTELFAMSVLGIAQFAPVYARRFFGSGI